MPDSALFQWAEHFKSIDDFVLLTEDQLDVQVEAKPVASAHATDAAQRRKMPMPMIKPGSTQAQAQTAGASHAKLTSTWGNMSNRAATEDSSFKLGLMLVGPPMLVVCMR